MATTKKRRRPALTEQMVREAVAREFGEGTYRRPSYERIADQLAALEAIAEDGVDLAVVVPGRTETRWMHRFCAPWEVRFLKGRVRFDGHKGAAPFPSAVVVMGPRAERGAVKFWDVRSELARMGA